jgi:hypothetical protein
MPTDPSRFIVMSARAKMPNSCFNGTAYRRIAVVEVDPAYTAAHGWPAMISERARGVVRIVALWDRLFTGKTMRCAFGRAQSEALDLCNRLNAGEGV